MSYLKGKDIKQKGDCLVYCYTRRIECIISGNYSYPKEWFDLSNKPEGFEKW